MLIGPTSKRPQPKTVGETPLDVQARRLLAAPLPLRSRGSRQKKAWRSAPGHLACRGLMLERQIARRACPPVELADGPFGLLIPFERRPGAEQIRRCAETAVRVGAEGPCPLVPQRSAGERSHFSTVDLFPVDTAGRPVLRVDQQERRARATVQRFRHRGVRVELPGRASRAGDEVDVRPGHLGAEVHRPHPHLIHPMRVDGRGAWTMEHPILAVQPVVRERRRPAVHRKLGIHRVQTDRQIEVNRHLRARQLAQVGARQHVAIATGHHIEERRRDQVEHRLAAAPQPEVDPEHAADDESEILDRRGDETVYARFDIVDARRQAGRPEAAAGIRADDLWLLQLVARNPDLRSWQRPAGRRIADLPVDLAVQPRCGRERRSKHRDPEDEDDERGRDCRRHGQARPPLAGQPKGADRRNKPDQRPCLEHRGKLEAVGKQADRPSRHPARREQKAEPHPRRHAASPRQHGLRDDHQHRVRSTQQRAAGESDDDRPVAGSRQGDEQQRAEQGRQEDDRPATPAVGPRSGQDAHQGAADQEQTRRKTLPLRAPSLLAQKQGQERRRAEDGPRSGGDDQSEQTDRADPDRLGPRQFRCNRGAGFDLGGDGAGRGMEPPRAHRDRHEDGYGRHCEEQPVDSHQPRSVEGRAGQDRSGGQSDVAAQEEDRHEGGRSRQVRRARVHHTQRMEGPRRNRRKGERQQEQSETPGRARRGDREPDTREVARHAQGAHQATPDPVDNPTEGRLGGAGQNLVEAHGQTDLGRPESEGRLEEDQQNRPHRVEDVDAQVADGHRGEDAPAIHPRRLSSRGRAGLPGAR